MGIETALVGAGLSATAASAVTTGLITTVVGAGLSAALAPKPQKPEAPTPIEKPPTAQAEKTVDRASLLSKNAMAASAAGALAGNGSTLLTGPQGAATGGLGTSTLLGN